MGREGGRWGGRKGGRGEGHIQLTGVPDLFIFILVNVKSRHLVLCRGKFSPGLNFHSIHCITDK